MVYVASPEDQARYLRRVRQAAGAALDNGATEDQVLEQVRAGLDEVHAERSRAAAARAGTSREPAPARTGTSALDAWAAQVA